MVIIAAKEEETEIVDHLTNQGFASWKIGRIVEFEKGAEIILILS